MAGRSKGRSFALDCKLAKQPPLALQIFDRPIFNDEPIFNLSTDLLEFNMEINNEFYEELGSGWLDLDNHPVALLRAENRLRAPWIVKELKKRSGINATVLDIGCGAGLLSNELAKEGFIVTGIDLSSGSLDVARQSDETQKTSYLIANACNLPFLNNSFDAVCAMDLLEHVKTPEKVIQEAARVLKPGGLFFFHTFNRNFFSYLLAIKAIDWFIPNAPPNLHVYSLFIKPKELKKLLEQNMLEPVVWKGLSPKLRLKNIASILLKRKVPSNFSFRFTHSLLTGYCGIAIKTE